MAGLVRGPWAAQHTLAAFSETLNTWALLKKALSSEFLPLDLGFCLLKATVFFSLCLGLVSSWDRMFLSQHQSQGAKGLQIVGK